MQGIDRSLSMLENKMSSLFIKSEYVTNSVLSPYKYDYNKNQMWCVMIIIPH